MSLKDPNMWQQILHVTPFFSLATAKAGEHVQRPLVTRITEGVIMGAVGGALGVYVSVKILENDVRHLRDISVNIQQQASQGIQGNTKRIERLEGLYFNDKRSK